MCLKKLYVLEQLELIFVIFGAQYPENHSFLSIGSKHTLTPPTYCQGVKIQTPPGSMPLFVPVSQSVTSANLFSRLSL